MAYEQPDEGYSEDPLTVGTSLSLSGATSSWLQTLPVSQRTEYVMSIIDDLPTSQAWEIVRRLRPRLYINFFHYLPPEVCLKILGFLDPVSLINTARASREWMQLAMDRKLWEQLYILEGFRFYPDEVRLFENEVNASVSASPRDTETGSSNKRRATPQRLRHGIAEDDSEMMDVDGPMNTSGSLFGPSKQSHLELDQHMTDRPTLSSWKGKSVDKHPVPESHSRRLSASSILASQSTPVTTASTLAMTDRSDHKKKLNWQYLYSQRRRLESNWESEKYTNFQLPHPDHPYEAHLECIYTIQFAGKYLVSGSRDKTLRIWNLNTFRLVRPPLEGHTGSVLCLQFDASPEEDIIVSGSSDSTIIIWKFSTGKIIQRLRKAHREPVLNVRFDKRVLVTCSKDKTIRIFNRRPMAPGEVGYLSVPSAGQVIGRSPAYKLNNFGYQPAPSVGLAIKPAWSQIAILEGHNAAVNAVQILGNEVVSASGDRTLKVWNWPEQTCIRTLIGHTKGIACVQYDGRRVVSGSSDNEVKVFDKESSLEVASLRAHTNLVRTVQVGFGDLPYSEEEDRKEAKATDNEYFKALDAGILDNSGRSQRNKPRNAGSRKPEDITAYGAKIPPGGGGGKFGRIVSGSYDETIIIWKRDKEGVWRPMHTLRQEEAAHFASISTYLRSAHRGATAVVPPAIPAPTPAATQSTTTTTGSYTSIQAPAASSSSLREQIITNGVQGGPHALRSALRKFPDILGNPRLAEAINQADPLMRQGLINAVTAALTSHHQQPGHAHNQGTADSGIANGSQSSSHHGQASSSSTQASSSSSYASSSTVHAPGSSNHAAQALQQPMVTTPTQTPSINPFGNQAPAPQAAAPAPIVSLGGGHPVPGAAPHAHHVVHHAPGNMMRVYKLQFDARRIICCSQTPVIVGWDFANGDEQILEASRFFAPIG